MTLKIDAKFEEKLICVSKLTRIWWILIQEHKSLKNLHFGPLRERHAMFDLKKYRGVIFHDTRERPLLSLKMGTLMGFFCPKLKIFELKIYRGVMCHENAEWCKNWREIDFSVQNWHKKFDEFWFKHLKISKIWFLKLESAIFLFNFYFFTKW